jgi:predicted RNase H-like HicB family nuclease
MRHYVAIFMQDDIGEWRASFPDLPGCEARGFSLDDVKFTAETALAEWIRKNGAPAPLPTPMAALQQDWLTKNEVDLSKAVVTMIPSAA